MIAAGVVAAVGATSSTALAGPVLPDFTVDQTSISNCATLPLGPCTFVADKMTGNYNEVLTVTGGNNFSTAAYWDLGQFVTNDGTTPVTAPFLGLPDIPGVTDGYKIYALFNSDGTFAANGSGGFDFTGATGGITLYLDPSVNSSPKTLPATAPGAVTVANSADDVLLATATLQSGAGRSGGGLASGDFGLRFNPFTLTAAGASIFVNPVPFYMTAVLKGQFNSFVPVGTQTINGSADATFAPEPASLTILGLGLLGSGMVARRRKNAAANL